MKRPVKIALTSAGIVVVTLTLYMSASGPASTQMIGKVTPVEASVDRNIKLIPAVQPVKNPENLPAANREGSKRVTLYQSSRQVEKGYDITRAITPGEVPVEDTAAVQDSYDYTVKHKYISHEMHFSDDAGQINAVVGGAYLNGAIVQPGEVFSFNRRVGPRTVKRGYVTGISIVNGKKAPDIGGGVCRLSTALHQAVMKAGFEVVERHVHSLPVSYAHGDNEAAVSWPDGDYKFKNNTDRPFQIEVISTKTSIEISFWSLGQVVG